MFECRKCKQGFGLLESSCGFGWSWGLYRCPYCQQLHAMAAYGGFVPDEVLKDKEIIVIESFRPTPRALDEVPACDCNSAQGFHEISCAQSIYYAALRQ